jgi:MoaA/NifB/PqqE/SkfB family radical SAM enzyme
MNKKKIILDGHKITWHAERVKAWLQGERVAPITIDCALTRACNYNCVYCYGKLQENQRKKISRDVILRFLDDAADSGVKAISFVSDGESTCSPYIYEAITHGRKNGLDMALGTNGYLLKKNRLDEILPALSYLRFNISAADNRSYAEIHGSPENGFKIVCDVIRACAAIKKKRKLDVTIGMQMVLLPNYADQVIPLAKIGKELGVDYLVIKHCSDDELGTLGVDYGAYNNFVQLLREAEAFSDENYLVKAKWSKILSSGQRCYSQCYGPPFMLQFSGSGLVAPCGMLFNERYKRFHIGNIVDTPFKKIWKGNRYWHVMQYIGSTRFNAHTECGTLCLQHKVNEYLWHLKNGKLRIERVNGPEPMHVNFI